MAKLAPKPAAKPIFLPRVRVTAPSSCSKCRAFMRAGRACTQFSRIRASHFVDDEKKVYKQLGLFSLRKKVEDAVLRAEMLAPLALELEEARQVEQEETIRDSNLWEDLHKSEVILNKLACSVKVVNALKDLKYKAEEAKLITQLADKDAVNVGLFKQAYDASLDVCKLLDQYETSKLLNGPFDLEGASLMVKAGSGGVYSEIWADQLFSMYMKWAKKQGYEGRVVEKRVSKIGSGIVSATIDFEFEFAYGYLLGEQGVHCMIRDSANGSLFNEAASASVDVVPLFLEKNYDIHIDEKDLIILEPSNPGEEQNLKEPTVSIQHVPTGITIQSSGERSQFANKMKALNRLKAKLLVIAREQGVNRVCNIDRDAILDVRQIEARRYVFQPYKIVEDVKTGVQLPDLSSVLNGNIEALIGAHVNIRRTHDSL